MNNHPVFSIITPTHNRPDFLQRNMQSVAMQTFSDYEHIIVDDSGRGEAKSITESLNDSRVVYLQHEKNKGAAAAYNSGIKISRGRYISFLDDDDEYKPEYLHDMYKHFEESKADFDFAWTGICRKSVSNMTEKSKFINWPECFENDEEGLNAATSIGNGFGLCLKKNCIHTIGLFDEKLELSSDTEFLFRLVQKFRFKVIPKILVVIYSHEGSQLTDHSNDSKRIKCYGDILNRNQNLLDLYPDLYSSHYNSLARLCYRTGEFI